MAGHVYLIGTRKFNWYKIGKSSNASIRIADLGILLPFRIEVIAVWRVENHHAVEQLLHERFEANRVNGEWFTFGANQLEKIVEEMKAVQVPVALGFTNIPKYVDTPMPPRKLKGGYQARMDKIIKEKYELEQRLKIAESKNLVQ